jgi:hypothetical protein
VEVFLGAVPFAALPDDARLWIFASPEPLSSDQSRALLDEVDGFLDGWLAHGHPVVGAREWRHDRFLLVGADERATGVSGCSIDSLFRVLKRLETEEGITLLDSSPVWFRGQGGEIRCVSRTEFRALGRAGEADADAVVFDNTVRAVGDLRQGRWETAARDSWHARLL